MSHFPLPSRNASLKKRKARVWLAVLFASAIIFFGPAHSASAAIVGEGQSCGLSSIGDICTGLLVCLPQAFLSDYRCVNPAPGVIQDASGLPRVPGPGDIASAVARELGNVLEPIINQALKVIIAPFILIPLFIVDLITTIGAFLVITILKWVLIITQRFVVYTSLDPALNPAVAVGWPIVRDFANILIVVAMIVIAIATILRWPPEYDARKALARLIVVALIVNFSLVICGFFIDASNIVMNYFIVGSSGSFGGLEKYIDIQSIDNIIKRVLQFLDPNVGPLQVVLQVAGAIYFNVMAIFIYSLFIFLFIARVIVLWMLVILSPLAFASFALPSTKRMIFDKWWNNFIQWCFVGVFGAFFLMVGQRILTASLANTSARQINLFQVVAGDRGFAELFQSFTGLFSLLLPGAFLAVGFFASLQMSAIGGSAAISLYNKARGYATGGLKVAGKFAADKTGATRGLQETKYAVTQQLESAGILRKGYTAAQRLRDQQPSREAEAAAAALPPEERQARINEGLGVGLKSRQDFAANFERAEEKGELQNLSDPELRRALDNYAEYTGKTEVYSRVGGTDYAHLDTQGVDELIRTGRARDRVDAGGVVIKTAEQEAREILGKKAGELEEKRTVERIGNLSTPEKLDELRTGVLSATATRQERRDSAIIYKELAKDNQLHLLDNDEQIDFLEHSRRYGVKPSEIAGKLSTENQNDIIRRNRYDAESREAALRSLGAKGQLNSAVAGAGVGTGALTTDEITQALDELRTNGSDVRDVLSSTTSSDLAQILTDEQDRLRSGGAILPVLDEPTRARILKALKDKGQLDLIGQIGETITQKRQRKIDSILEAADQGVLPEDIVSRLNSEDQAEVLNDSTLLLDRLNNDKQRAEVTGKAVAALSKKGQLDLVRATRRPDVYRTAVQNNSIEAEDLERSDYHAAEFNEGRRKRIEDASSTPLTPAQVSAKAKDQVLNQRIKNFDGDQLRNIDEDDLYDATAPAVREKTYKRLSSALTPAQVREFESATPTRRQRVKDALGTGGPIDADITEERDKAANALAGLPATFAPAGDIAAATAGGVVIGKPNEAQATSHTNEAIRLEKLRKAADKL